MPKKILVIDDDKTFVKMVRSSLEVNHFDVISAFDGDEGLEKAKTLNPDLIILDIEMPKMDGYTFMLEMKKIVGKKDIPILIITAKESMQDIFKMEGVKEYIVKPVNSNQLMVLINKHLPK